MTAPVMMMMTIRTSGTVMLVRGTAGPRPGAVISTAPPIRTVVATMTMTYVRSDALCSAGAMVRLTALSTESAPS